MTAVYFANPNSVHVRRWLDLAGRAGIRVLGFSAHRVEQPAYGEWRQTITTGGVLRYALAGLWLRVRAPRGAVVHAHNASGYGMMALLSGRQYVVTIYGTEVYGAAGRGRVYRMLLRRVLAGAVRVTCTTPHMREHVVAEYGLDPARVHMFSMGLSNRDFYFSEQERAQARSALGLDGAVVLTSCRRMRPQYRIDMIVRAFALLRARDPRYRLVVFEGDSLPGYAADIRQLTRDLGIAGDVVFMDGVRGPGEVRRHLLASDLAISIPVSDQLSAAILEALACGAAVLAAELPAYEELFREGLAEPAAVQSDEALAASVERAVAALDGLRAGYGRRLAWLEEAHSDRAVTREIVRLYEGAGAR
ncbi:MAG: glycosyltransferase [Gemmatimonadetes bacterium]|nr:glycosyltransferase [Gemmatimonadota bacterium]